MFHQDDRLSMIAEADREYAHNVGETRRDQAWILSDRDVWYANPFYTGPAVPHPEDAEEGQEGFLVFATMQEAADAAKRFANELNRSVRVVRAHFGGWVIAL